MSADEFDPAIERLFARSPNLPDAPMFAAGVEARLATGSRVRALVLGLAGVTGGVVAVRETVASNISFSAQREGEAVSRVSGGVEGLAVQAQSAVQSGLGGLCLDQVDLGAFGGMHLFWIAAGALMALAIAGVMKLSETV